MTTRARLTSFLLVGLLALFGAACSKDAAEVAGEPGSASEVNRVVELTTTNELRFDPSEIDVEAGETIEFKITNDASSEHEFVIGSANGHSGDMHHAEPNATGSIEPGATATVVWHFTEAGKATFACYIAGHNEAGMTGTVTISG